MPCHHPVQIGFNRALLSFSALAIAGLPLISGFQQPAVANSPVPLPHRPSILAQNPASPAIAETIKNLQAAYNGESNAHVRYLAFAKKADQEGYKQVAVLFRATAKAEAIHRDRHATVIRQMGGTPTAKIEAPTVKSTRENLQAAEKGESYERDTMYPQFSGQARKASNKAAVQSFDYAANAEAGHAKFYAQALTNLEQWKVAKSAYYVCPECGLTVAVLNFEECSECGVAKAKFVKVV